MRSVIILIILAIVPLSCLAEECAVAYIYGSAGGVTGYVTFKETIDGETSTVKLGGVLNGLPQGKHGVIIHVWADITKGCDSVGMGEHLNPKKQDHGLSTDTVRHLGDLGNVAADSSGTATFTQTLTNDISLCGDGEYSIIAKSVSITENEDVGGAIPDLGKALACGVIGRADCATVKAIPAIPAIPPIPPILA